ncbi:MAG: peptidoglycan editing factor PgeF [Oscillatoriaceae bacterium SKW80]|nr:peptidoglycan editing factor PgeF [Oscillatoriaceae bacterium SKYG93]MCX8119551.1 peptidoglycan editing factor PgeF [Oscillatoriaceae bacterium SKW80]MDW8455018.1 peptidoglycan editing factor PgeF [Oscillatoriaceae cyanobacterium SKYGB_i_bin93]HIK28205.1 peptidoglycan editing factor PgeF [Oscillatoriaceae cyanobacterium M7585_C2015_266]
MHNWHWRTWNGLPYLTCSFLEKWPHGFFTQQFWPRLPAELVEALHPKAETYRVKQVHGNRVLSTKELESTVKAAATELPQADGLLTEAAGEAVWVASADCTPVLIADERTGQVAAVHAGWRGTAAKIVPSAIARLQEKGSQLKDLRIALGPAIAGEVYQVSTEVAAEVTATIAPTETTDDPTAILDAVQQIPQPPVLPDSEPGRVRLDVRRTIALQLEQLSIYPEQIAIAPYCTYQSPEHFFSYRRDNLKKVQWSGIVSV